MKFKHVRAKTLEDLDCVVQDMLDRGWVLLDPYEIEFVAELLFTPDDYEEKYIEVQARKS